MAEYDIKELKAAGFMKQKEKDLFSVRLRVVGGYIKAEQLPGLVQISQRFGKGYVHLTARQGIEIPFVNFNDFDKIREELLKIGLEVGACGPRVRTVTACQGEICSHGLIDAQELAGKIDEKFFGQGGLPHKFKIGVVGCPNACLKPTENDLGVMGRLKKNFLKEKCNYCGLCAEVCPVKCIKVQRENGKLIFDARKCIGCGDCVFVCPQEAWEKRNSGYRVYVGGKMGKFPHLGHKAFDFIESEEKLLQIIEKTLGFYKAKGKRGERFAETIDRVGLKDYKKQIQGKIQ
jgi:dissimilatory sulfite reductase (desulfoviridin) alpha/beta subunit